MFRKEWDTEDNILLGFGIVLGIIGAVFKILSEPFKNDSGYLEYPDKTELYFIIAATTCSISLISLIILSFRTRINIFGPTITSTGIPGVYQYNSGLGDMY